MSFGPFPAVVRPSRPMVMGVLLAFTAAVLPACGGSPAASTPVAPERRVTPKVVIISVDGLRPDALSADHAPHIVALALRGAYSHGAQTIYPPVTLPSHGSMLSGFPPAAHGLVWNDYEPERGSIRVPTVFSRAREAGLRTVALAGKNKFLHFKELVDRFSLGGSDLEIASFAVGHAQAFDVMFVHLPETDLTGHASSWMSSAYLRAVRNADEAVGQIAAAVPPETTIIITADHGGVHRNHGANRPSDMTIPWIIAGPDVLPGHVLGPVNTMDTAATALYVLGLQPTPGALGRAVTDAFRVQPATASSLSRRAS